MCSDTSWEDWHTGIPRSLWGCDNYGNKPQLDINSHISHKADCVAERKADMFVLENIHGNVQRSYASLCCSNPFPFPPIHLWLSNLHSWKTYLEIGTMRDILDWCFTSLMMFHVFKGLYWVRLYWTVMYSHVGKETWLCFTCLCWGSTPGYTNPPSV